MSNNNVFIDEDLLNEPNEAFPTINRSRKNYKPTRPGFITYFAVMYILSAVSGICGFFPLLFTYQSYPPIFALIAILLAIFQIIINGAVGIGLWTIKSWAWWLVTFFNPLSAGFGFTITFLMMKDFISGMNEYVGLSSSETIEFQNIFSVGMIIGSVISLAIIAIIQLIFWSNRVVFFGSKDLPMSLAEFSLMQLVVIVFSIVLALVVYLIVQAAGFSFDIFLQGLEGLESLPY